MVTRSNEFILSKWLKLLKIENLLLKDSILKILYSFILIIRILVNLIKHFENLRCLCKWRVFFKDAGIKKKDM